MRKRPTVQKCGPLVRAGVVLAVATLLAATACSSGASGSSAGASDLDVLIPSQADVLDPTRVSAQALGGLLIALEPLVRYRSDGSLTPLLAESVATPDPNTYVYTLREGVSFWDGSPLTAEDVRFSFELHSADDSQSLIQSFWDGVTGIEVTGDREVTVTLDRPDPQFPYAIATTPIVSQAFYQANGDSIGTPGTLNMGTGPYEFTSFTPSTETQLEANPDYWGDAPAYDQLTLRTVSDDSARLTAIQSGEFDAIYNIPIAQLESFTSLDGFTTVDAPDLMIYKFNFDMTKAPWNDVHLRRAFAMAVNRPDIVQGALAGRAELAPTVVPADVMSTLLDTGTVEQAYQGLEDELRFDLDAARAELAKSGTPKGLDVSLLTVGSDPNLSLIAQTAAQTLAEIGIRLDVKEVDDNTYYERVYFTHTTDGLSLDGFSGPNPDPITMPLYSLDSAYGLPKGGAGSNLADYDNPEVDALLEQSRSLAADDPERGELILRALAVAQEDLPYLPIAFPEVYSGTREGLAIGRFDAFWWLADWPAEIATS